MKRFHEKDEKTRIKESDEYAVMKRLQELSEPEKRKKKKKRKLGEVPDPMNGIYIHGDAERGES